MCSASLVVLRRVLSMMRLGPSDDKDAELAILRPRLAIVQRQLARRCVQTVSGLWRLHAVGWANQAVTPRNLRGWTAQAMGSPTSTPRSGWRG
jgi:hypothetical protein